jgi:hypothetical protein
VQTWRCPHCGTPQAETSRCWVCLRSSTSCGTCRHFRHSIAPSIGYCGLDPRRLPLAGDEIRGCWEVAPIPAEVVGGHPGGATSTGLDFVPVDTTGAGPTPDTTARTERGAFLLFDLDR